MGGGGGREERRRTDSFLIPYCLLLPLQVVVNDSLLAYSKLSTGVFPDFNAVARDIAAYAASGAVPPSWSTVK